MKYGKYYATGLVMILLIGGGTGMAISHNNNEKVAETHKNDKSSSSSSHKVKKHNIKKHSSSESSSSENSSPSSESLSSSSKIISSQPQTSSSIATNSTTGSGQPTPQTPVAAFIQQYGVTPAQWLVQNKGMSIKDALYATPDDQETSGELQTEWSYKQGTHDQMITDNNDSYDKPD